MKLVDTLFILLFPLGLLCQNPVVDSLRRELEIAKADTSIVKYSIDLAVQLSGIHPDSARLLCREAAALIPSIENAEVKAAALNKVGRGYHSIRQLDTALLFLEEGRQLAEEIGFKSGLAFILNSMGNVYRSKDDPEKALAYFRQALDLHKESGNKEEQTAMLNNIAIIYMEQGDFAQATSLYQEALQIQEVLGNKAYQAVMYQNLALCEKRKSDFKQAIEYYKRAAALFHEVGDVLKEAQMLALLGAVYRDQGNYTQAIAVNQKALDLRRSLGNKKFIAYSLTNFGTIYDALGDYAKSIDYFQEALDTLEVLGDKSGQVGALVNIGRNLKFQGDYKSALIHLYGALQLRREIGPERFVNIPLYDIGSTYREMGLLDSAYTCLQASLDISRQFKDAQYQILCLTELGRIYNKRGETGIAIAALEEAYALSPEDAYQNERLEIAKELYQTYKTRGNASKALEYLEYFKALQDGLFNEENTKAITRLESEYEFEQEKQQLAHEQEKELRRQRYFQIATASALAIALIFIFIIARYYRLKRRANEALTRLNEEILEQKEQLQELDHLKSRFFTNISHELRTPLTIIGGMAQQIKKSPEQWLEKGIKLIERNNASLLNLVNQILDLRKLESGALQLNLIQADSIFYLRYILESFHSLAESKDIQLHFLNDEKELMMDYDEEKLLRIVSNLLSNAIKFTPEGGNVYLMVSIFKPGSAAGHEKIQPFPTPNDQGFLEITVKDTGIGIPEKKLPYVFDRFYQVDDSTTRKGEGTGIGLALTNELVKLVKGEIKVESEVGKGTKFMVRLPIRNEADVERSDMQANVGAMDAVDAVDAVDTMDVERSDIPANVGAGDSQTIGSAMAPAGRASIESSVHRSTAKAGKDTLLIIEDNPDLVVYLESLLEDYYQLLIARDGQEGIEMALEQIPDLILSDVMMPKKNGYEVCSALRKDARTSHIPIVLLTAKATVESRIEGLERGADAYLAKPFNQEELFVRLKKLAELRRQMQQRYQSLGPPAQSGSPAEEPGFQQEDAFIAELREAVEANMENPDFGTAELCKAIGMSRSHLHLKIKALIGRPTSNFIRAIRLHKAKNLLQNTDLNVTQVAYEVGFRDPAYFSRKFTEEFGVYPKNVMGK